MDRISDRHSSRPAAPPPAAAAPSSADAASPVVAARDLLVAAAEAITNAAVYIVDPATGTVIYANGAAETFFGRPLDEIVGQTFHTGSRPQLPAQFDAVSQQLRSRGRVRFECPITRPDGVAAATLRLSLFHVDGRAYVLAIGYTDDMREAAQAGSLAEAAEPRLAERLSHFADIAPGVMFTIAIDERGNGKLFYASKGFYDLVGVPPLLLGTSLRRLIARIAPADRPVLAAEWREAAATGRPVKLALRLDHPQHGQRWIELFAHHQAALAGGRVLHGYLQDVTERRRNDEALRDIRQTHQDVFTYSSECICVFDCTAGGGFRVVALNPAGLRLFNSEVLRPPLGQPMEETFSAAFTERLRARLGRVVAEGQVCDDEIPAHVSLIGRWLRLRLVPIADEAGEVRRVVAFCRDITQEQITAAERFGRQQQFNNLVAQSPDPIARFDRDLRRVYCNEAFYAVAGGTPETMLGRTPAEASILGHDLATRYMAFLGRVLEDGSDEEMVLEYARPDGRPIIVSVRGLREYDHAGNRVGVMVVLRDMTDRVLVERRLADRERDFRQLVENSPDMISRHDLNGRRLYENPAFRERVGEPYGAWCSVSRADLKHIATAIRMVGQTGAPYGLEIAHGGRDGRRWWSHYTITPECAEDGRVVAVLCIGRDITETVIYRERLTHAAYVDALTDLPNRARLIEVATERIRSGQTFMIMLMDLDGFKEVNDGLGHDAGDALLRVIARRLVRVVGEGGLVGRLGGDEFAIIIECDEAGGDDGGRIAERILAAVIEPAEISGREIFVSASIGIARHPLDATGVDQLIACADAAMYRAKADGRNNYRLYTAEMSARAIERMLLAGSLRKADQRGEFVLHYQPQFDLSDGRLTGVEALLRWQHPDLGLVMPDRFIAIAEETGLIVDIGRWAIAEAARAAVRWNSGRTHPVRVSVNLSARQFMLNDLAATVRAILAETGCKPAWLELEITESLLLGDNDVTASLEALTAIGITIAIDDFGTGYSALGYLHRFPIHTLKIDRSFMQDIEVDKKKSGIVRAIISIAAALDMRLVAEGVETAQQVQVLDGFGCHAAQGYYFGRPVGEAEFVRLHLAHAGAEPANPWDCRIVS
jgi:diguanylate cyclase (GGDEF)-like protein/PAS domain S-box-containing protein